LDEARRGTAGFPSFTAATLAAAAGLILLIVGLALYIYYYEGWMDHVTSDERDFDDIASLFDIARASMYITELGQIAAVSALLFIVHGAMNGQRQGLGQSLPGRVTLANVKLLLLVVLVCIVIATMSIVYLYEFQDDNEIDFTMRISSLYYYLPMLAWAIGALALLLVAKGLRTESSSRMR
jgi:hypothetical protein